MGSANEREQGTAKRVVSEPLLSFVLLEGLLPIGGGELEDAALRPIGEQVEEISKVAPGLDVVELAACDERDEDGVGERAILRAYEDPVFRPTAWRRRFLSEMLFDIGSLPSSRNRSSAFC